MQKRQTFQQMILQQLDIARQKTNQTKPKYLEDSIGDNLVETDFDGEFFRQC